MKLQDLHESYENIWYHGSGNNFDKFNIDAVKENRGTNVAGIYITKNEDLARDYASKSGGQGFVYEVEHNTHNPFNDGSDKFTSEMMDKYVELLVRHTNYNKDWARSTLVPEAIKAGKMKADLDGEIKRQVYQSGGYDSLWFNDMGDRVLVVFDPTDLSILNKFQPQKLTKDSNYDDEIQSKDVVSKPNQPKPKSSLDFFGDW